ncbi:fumarylacetoacetate hydrolase family protein [Paraburkholderia sp. MMS20-SJTR3]|uniref:Fumarylacetoacetate hydrolase family protein n=1 Tax=Paraburkholderia sejongensis TaxID=2886946 RepID=A0ABS8JV50_9BURK|nr:fumarylacetoacetate hydrolase family protein [Paraburkholderia sp. MMS20-SJTR3]MCC8393583.1 fumarylacetoacetate hydrolase family protein [Paraburkholderia sp. MMS20-SJTR3]
MKVRLATLDDGSADGTLVAVSLDGARAVSVAHIAPNLLYALEHWERVAGPLEHCCASLDAGGSSGGFAFDHARARAPLPRSFQWCDASAFLSHGELMERAFNTQPMPDAREVPLMYQGASDDFLGPCEDVPLPDEADQIDFEGEFGVIVGATPMGVSARDALGFIRLVVQLNDWSLRALGPREMKSGFGFLQAKPSTSFAPVAVTPAALGDAWQDGRLAMKLRVERDGAWFGEPDAREMHFHFGELIAHAARSRSLSAGTVIGSGTVSNYGSLAGSACIAERRVIELLDSGVAQTSFMRFGERVRMQAIASGDGATPFGAIDQRVVRAHRVAPCVTSCQSSTQP